MYAKNAQCKKNAQKVIYIPCPYMYVSYKKQKDKEAMTHPIKVECAPYIAKEVI